MVSAAFRAMSLPVTSPPVKDTISTSGLVDSGVPQLAPAPVIRLATPAGTPASARTGMSRVMTWLMRKLQPNRLVIGEMLCG